MLARRAGVPVVAAVFGVLVAAPAFADVSVSPTSAVQGSGENITFHVTNTGTQPIGTVQLKLPQDTPVAEVYPLSVDDWAPKIETVKLSSPLPTIHGGIPADETTGSITWIAMPGLALAPGKATDLTIAIGPLPTLSSMRFTLVTKYTDGKPGPAMSPASIALTPAVPGQTVDPHAGHDGSATVTPTDPAAADPNAADDAAFAQAVANATRGPSVLSMAGWFVAALVLLGAVVMMLRNRHRAEEDDEPEDEDATAAGDKPKAEVEAGEKEAEAGEKEPVTAGSSKWSFKG